MFDKIKQGKELLQLRSQVKKLQSELSEIAETVETKGIRVKVSADQKIVYIEKDGMRQKDLEEVINEAFKKVQKKAAKMMKMSGGLTDFLSGLK